MSPLGEGSHGWSKILALGEHQQVLGEGLPVHSTFVSWSKEVQSNDFTSSSTNN